MRAFLLGLALLFATVLSAPSQAAPAGHESVRAAPISAYLSAPEAADPDCLGGCVFCGHSHACAHCNGVPLSAADGTAAAGRPGPQFFRPIDYASRALAHAAGPYRPPRA